MSRIKLSVTEVNIVYTVLELGQNQKSTANCPKNIDNLQYTKCKKIKINKKNK